jgi:hypothetical protein
MAAMWKRRVGVPEVMWGWRVRGACVEARRAGPSADAVPTGLLEKLLILERTWFGYFVFFS